MKSNNKQYGWAAVLVIIFAVIVAILSSCSLTRETYWIEITHHTNESYYKVDTIKYIGFKGSEFKLSQTCNKCYTDLVAFNPNMPIRAEVLCSRVTHYRLLTE